jgi:YbbR domain-containing protein
MAFNPFRRFWSKAVSVGIATLLWLAVGGEKQVERSLRAPLELQNVPVNLELVGEAPSAVDVRVRGASSALSRMAQGDAVAVLDVSSARPGRNLFRLGPTSVRVPFGVDVTYAGPATLPLVFERQAVKRIPVVAAVEGEPAPGFAIERVVVEPVEVDVVGPESALRDLRQATTDSIELDGSMGPVRESVAIGILNSAARLRASQSAVVTVDIQPVRTERTIGTVPVRMQRLRNGLVAQSAPPSVAVTVRGGESVLKTLGTDGIDAAVDLNGLGAGRYTLPVRVAPSGSFGVVRIEPPEVRVTIR